MDPCLGECLGFYKTGGSTVVVACSIKVVYLSVSSTPTGEITVDDERFVFLCI